MEVTNRNILLCVLYIVAQAKSSEGITWHRMKCATDTEQTMPEGDVPEIGRFPWLGIVQHEFYLGGKTRFAITAGILIHPGFVLSVAEDIAKIAPEQVVNNTKFICWKSAKEKFSLDVREYILHPEYQEKETYASVALLELANWGDFRYIAPVKPICLPFKGVGLFTDLYAVKMSDESKEMKKQAFKMNYVTDQDCEEFYYRAHLSLKTMSPSYPMCAVSERMSAACVWDGGVALVTRQNWGYWMLLGFGVRGPGCGAPSRFVSIHRFLQWIDEVITYDPLSDLPPGETAFYLRQLSPINLVMYKGDVKLPKAIGQCERKERGNVLYKESDEFLTNKNFGQGYYFVSVSQVAQFLCATVHLEANTRTNAAVWIEHNCHRDVTGMAPGMKAPDHRKMECFLYYSSKAFIEFRFFFSFKATIEVTLFGTVDDPPMMPNPFFRTETTDVWWPTRWYFNWGSFFPIRLWRWYL